MKEHPILFQTEMIQAILQGRKTMTRRIIKNFDIKINEFGKIDYSGKTRFGHNCDLESINDKFLGIVDNCPYGKIGDTLWVRETFTILEPEHCATMAERFVYKADMKDAISEEMRQDYIKHGWPYQWRPSIFMPRAASRITLKITNIKVERVQDISEEDAIKEGVDLSKVSGDWEHTPVQEFESLWVKINGQESWDSNPFCWCVEFEKL